MNEWMNDELHLKCRSLELLSGQQTSRGLSTRNPLAFPYQRLSSTESNSERPRPLNWWALLVLICMKPTANGSAPKAANWACKWVTAHLVMDPIQLCLLTFLLDITKWMIHKCKQRNRIGLLHQTSPPSFLLSFLAANFSVCSRFLLTCSTRSNPPMALPFCAEFKLQICTSYKKFSIKSIQSRLAYHKMYSFCLFVVPEDLKSAMGP